MGRFYKHFVIYIHTHTQPQGFNVHYAAWKHKGRNTIPHLSMTLPHPLSLFIHPSLHLSFIDFSSLLLLSDCNYNHLILLSSLHQPFIYPLLQPSFLFPLSKLITRISSSCEGYHSVPPFDMTSISKLRSQQSNEELLSFHKTSLPYSKIDIKTTDMSTEFIIYVPAFCV